MVALIGANGAGKTTLLNAISGIVPCASGDIKYNGEKISEMSPPDIVRSGITQVPEGRLVFADMSVSENLEIGCYLRKDKKEEINKSREQVFELFQRKFGNVTATSISQH